MAEERKSSVSVRGDTMTTTYIILIIGMVAGQAATLINGGARWSVLDIAIIGSVLLWSIGVAQGSRRYVRGRLGKAIFLFVLASFLTAVAHAGGTANAVYAARWFAYAALYWIALSDKRSGDIWKWVLYGSGAGLALLGFVQRVWYPDLRNLMYLGWDPHYLRVFTTLFDPNFAGIMFVLTFLTGLSLWTSARRGRRVILAGQTGVILALGLTYSRSSFLAFGAGLIFWCVLRRSYRLLVGLIAAFAVFVLLLPHAWEGQQLWRTTSAWARVASMEVGLERIAASPVWGRGFVVQRELPPGVSLPPGRAGGVDTSILYVFASAGLVGGAAYLFLCREWIMLARDAVRSRSHDPLFGSILAALGIHSVFVNSLLYPWVMAWVWILAAVTERKLTAGR